MHLPLLSSPGPLATSCADLKTSVPASGWHSRVPVGFPQEASTSSCTCLFIAHTCGSEAPLVDVALAGELVPLPLAPQLCKNIEELCECPSHRLPSHPA